MHWIGQNRMTPSRRSYEESSGDRRIEKDVMYRGSNWEEAKFLFKRKKVNLKLISLWFKFRNYEIRWILWTIPGTRETESKSGLSHVLSHPVIVPSSFWNVLQRFMRLMKNSNLKDCNYTKRINGLIRLNERRLIYVENWKWETDSMKKVMWELAKK